MDRLREAVGDAKLTYLGFSYGTFLGRDIREPVPEPLPRARARRRDRPDQYIDRPVEGLSEQTAASSAALGRFLQACAADQATCPLRRRRPVGRLRPADRPADATRSRPPHTPDRVRSTATTSRSGSIADPLQQATRPFLAAALTEAEAGDASLLRFLADLSCGRNDDGTYDPGPIATSRFGGRAALPVATSATTSRRAPHSWGLFDHFWINSGYSELAAGCSRCGRGTRSPARSAAAEPAAHASWSAPPTTPRRRTAAPSASSRELGNARLLTMRGDGHTAYGGNSSCIDAAVDAYLEDLAVPAAGTSCKQEVPFGEPQAQARGPRRTRPQVVYGGPGVKPLAR